MLCREPFPSCTICTVVSFRFSERLFPGPGAGDGTRTRNLLITNQLLCQLSYASQKAIERYMMRAPAAPHQREAEEFPPIYMAIGAKLPI